VTMNRIALDQTRPGTRQLFNLSRLLENGPVLQGFFFLGGKKSRELRREWSQARWSLGSRSGAPRKRVRKKGFTESIVRIRKWAKKTQATIDSGKNREEKRGRESGKNSTLKMLISGLFGGL